MIKHFLTFLSLLLFACNGDEIPKDILPVDKMALILVDVHLAEARVEEMKLSVDTAQLVFAYYEKEIFKKHDVDREVYNKSFKYHLSNITTMDQVYSIVVDSLNVRRQVTKID